MSSAMPHPRLSAIPAIIFVVLSIVVAIFWPGAAELLRDNFEIVIAPKALRQNLHPAPEAGPAPKALLGRHDTGSWRKQRGDCFRSVESGQLQLPSPDCYTVGLITTLPIELAAVQSMLDSEHLQPAMFEQPETDTTVYSWGRIGHHNIVIASPKMGMYGKANAASAVEKMIASITSIRMGLLVGIGGGVPGPNLNPDIRLGDVVVSAPRSTSGGILQYDVGKEEVDGFKRVGLLKSPPDILLSAVTTLEARHELGKANMTTILDEALQWNPTMADVEHDYTFPGSQADVLFRATSNHAGSPGCAECNHKMAVPRPARASTKPRIHYGVITSRDRVIKDARKRDDIVSALRENEGVEVFAFEMEAAGLMNSFPCLVIRGISDYADTHKYGMWQRYAAVSAAAYAKELLRVVPPRDIEALPRAIETIEALNSSIEKLRQSDENRVLQRWLQPPDPTEQYNRAIEARHDGTGSWLLHGSQFAAWESASLPHLWIHGIMGSGKTVLAAMVIEHLQGNCLYFFFDHTDGTKQDLFGLLRSLVYQLHTKHTTLGGTVQKVLNLHRDGKQQPSEQTLQKLLATMIWQLGGTCIVLDALDECEKRGKILSWMEDFHRTGSPIRFIVTSRREVDIEQALIEWLPQHSIIEVQRGNVSRDIRSYVDNRIRTDAAFRRWRTNPDIQTEIITELTQKADGMFRLADLQLQELESCFTVDALREQLLDLPQTLNDAYTKILQRVLDSHGNDALRILQLLAFSIQPIDIDGIADILAFVLDPFFEDTLVYSPTRKMPDSSDTLRIGRGLVGIHTGSQSFCDGTSHKDVQFARLAHLSVHDYLVSPHADVDLGGKFDERAAHADVARLCLAYLIRVGRKLPRGVGCSELPQEDTMRDFPFLKHALDYVLLHFGATEDIRTILQVQILKLGMSGHSTFYLPEMLGRHTCGKEVDSTITIPVAAQSRIPSCSDDSTVCGMPDQVTEDLIKAGLEAFLWYHNTTPLHYAMTQDDIGIPELLIAHGIDWNVSSRWGTSLHVAIVHNRTTVVESLIAKGVDLNISPGYEDTPLGWAISMGDESMLRLLLDNGADINSRRDFLGFRPLELALLYGKPEIVKLLLQRGATTAPLLWQIQKAQICCGEHDLEQLAKILDWNYCCLEIGWMLRVYLNIRREIYIIQRLILLRYSSLLL